MRSISYRSLDLRSQWRGYVDNGVLTDAGGQGGFTQWHVSLWRPKFTLKSTDTSLTKSKSMFMGKLICRCLPSIRDTNLKAKWAMSFETANSCVCDKSICAQLGHHRVGGCFGGGSSFFSRDYGGPEKNSLERADCYQCAAENHQKQIEPPRRIIWWARVLSSLCFICGCIYCARNSVYNFLRGSKVSAWGFCVCAILCGQLAAFTLRWGLLWILF
jgi:hypothetical protein